jgi:hypothetical protein
MSALSIQPTFPIFTDIDGQPLEDGYIFIGVANLQPIGNPIIVYQNAALTTVAVQPIRTRGGYPVFSGTPGRLYVNSDYSIQVQNKNGSVVYSAPTATERYNGVVISSIDASQVEYTAPGLGAVQVTLQNKLQSQVISITDYGADPTGVADSTTAILAAETARPSGATLVWPQGTYRISADITATKPGVWDMKTVTINSAAGKILFDTNNFELEGNKSTFNFIGSGIGGDGNRAIRVAGAYDPTEYDIAAPIAVGATSFTASNPAQAATLSPNQWIIVIDRDVTNWIRIEFKQVLSVVGATVNVTNPFGMPFSGTYPIKWVSVTKTIENCAMRNLNIVCPSAAPGQHLGFDGQPCVFNFETSGCTFNIASGLAWQSYGHYNPMFFNNVIKRQQGRRSAISSTQGGHFSNNIFWADSASPTNGSLTIETGTYGTTFQGNKVFGGAGASGLFYINNVYHCSFIDNLLIGDGLAIGLLVQGATDNVFVGNTLINVSEGITVTRDNSLTPILSSTANYIADTTTIQCLTGIKFASAGDSNNVINGLKCDSTATARVLDSGTNNLSLLINNPFNSYQVLGGLAFGNANNSNVNVLDYYLEGTFTPDLTFNTPGDVAVSYSTRVGKYTRVGNRIFVEVSIVTSSFTHTTAAGNLLISNMPFAPIAAGTGSAAVAGWTKAGYTQITAGFAISDTRMNFLASGSGQAQSTLSSADVPTGGTVTIRASGWYEV